MVLSLFGIILIQGLWIKYAVETEKARFDQLVYSSMKSALSKVERSNVFEFIDERIELPEPISEISVTVEELNEISESMPPLSIQSPIRIIKSKDVDNNIRITYDMMENGDEEIFIIDSGDNVISYELDNIDNDYIVDLFEDDHGLFVEIEDSLNHILELKREELIQEKEEIVKYKWKIFNENMEQWTHEFSYDQDYYLTKHKTTGFNNAIKNSLINFGIELDYDYQLIKEKNDTTLIISSSTTNNSLIDADYKTEVYPDDFFSKQLFLIIRFPDKNKHIYRKVSLLVAGSIIFTIIILLTFGTTLYYIRKQKKLSEIKSDFINNMTHEFKTPIATIRLATDALESPKVMGNKKPTLNYLDIIRQENKRMNNQVERVLQMALIEQGKLQIDLQNNDIHEIILNGIKVVELIAKKNNGIISCSLRASQHMLNIDEVHIANVINNLLDNALKYTDKQPDIVVETYNEKGMLCVRISDNGVGMSKEIQNHIFDKFYRKPMGNIHNIKGFGLGLSYVKAVIQAHNASISVNSEPGNGSTFIMKFVC